MATVLAFGYGRVSTAEQAREGLSLALQRERCEAYARALGWDWAGWWEDAGRSGRSLARPGVELALREVRARRGTLLVYSLDRLTRSVADLGRLLEETSGGWWELASVTDALQTGSAAGRLVAHVLGSVAQWQREQGAERVADALRHAKSKGARIGRLPLGEVRGVELDGAGRRVVLRDVAGVARVAALVAISSELGPGATLAKVAGVANERGVAGPSGGRWHAESVRRVLLRAGAVTRRRSR